MTELRAHTAIKAYCQHGFFPTGETESEIYGNCPFCGKKDRLYVNKDSKAWDCKVCQKHGGFLTFLEEISKLCQEHFKGTVAIKLSKSRGISIATLKKFKIGYNPITKNYCFPIVGADGKRLHDLRIYKNGKLISTASCKTGLLNWEKIYGCNEIFLCEGEWDGMCMQEALDKLGLNNVTATAVPGAGVFKAVWVPLFVRKTVHVLYDNDKPGQAGALKVFNTLRRDCSQLNFLHWSSDFEDNFDIRDLNQKLKNAVRLHNFIMANLHDLPMNADIDEVMGAGANAREKFDGEGISAENVYDAYRKWLYLPDTSVLDVVYGTIIANRLEGDPLWVFIVAPPGMTKTSILQTVADASEVVAVSTLTANSLISGSNAGGVDPSLAPRLNKKVLAIKDFTPILNMHIQARDEIFGVLRDLYDGECTKTYGHGITRHVVSKFGIIAGVTPAIETFVENESALGERFLRFAMKLPSSIKEHMVYMRRATENIRNKDTMLSTMREIGPKVLDYDFKRDVEVPDEIHTKVLYLAMWTAQLRGTIIRDRFSKEILFKPFQELGTRICQQYIKLLLGIGMFRRIDKIGGSEFEIIRKLALGSVPSKLEDAVSKLYKWGITRKFQTAELAEMVRLPQSTVQQMVNSLHILGVLKKVRLSSVKTEFMFSENFLYITESGGVYENK